MKDLDIKEFTKLEETYKIFNIFKNGNKRTIYEPTYQLKQYQTNILSLLEQIPFPHFVYGLKGRSAIANGFRHLDKKIIINMDIKRFYSSTTLEKVCAGLRRIEEQYSYLFIQKNFESWIKEIKPCFVLPPWKKEAFLPTGSPSSPLLANIAFFKLDQLIDYQAGLAGLVYTRYMDDLTFSGQEYPKGFQNKINEIVRNAGYRINHKKSKLTFKNQDKQLVTGVAVNSTNRIDANYIKKLRAELDHHARTSNLLNKYLLGKISYIGQINKDLENKYHLYFQKRVVRYNKNA